MKRDRFKGQDGFAGLIHRFNVFLKAARGVTRAELTVGVYDDIYAVAVSHCRAPNVADIAPVAQRSSPNAPIQITLSAAGDVEAGCRAQSNVAAAAGVVRERNKANGDVAIASGVVKERRLTIGCIGAADGVAKERAVTGSGVEACLLCC